MNLILSSSDVDGIFVGAKAKSDNSYQDFEDGPVAIGDISKGLNYQIWWAEIDDDKIFLLANNQERQIFITANDITEVSISFDGNARPIVAYIANKTGFLKYFDSFSSAYVTLNLGSIKSPKVFMDDKRAFFQAESDVILVFVRDNKLIYKLQKDRFNTDYIVADGVGLIERFGMLNNYRLGVRLKQGNPPKRL